MNEEHVVILTALGLEYEKVRAGLRDLRTHVHPAGTRFEIGRLDPAGCLVALALTGKGNLPAATLTERAITEFSPAAVIFVGIAAARQPHVELGDVVVATHVYAYHGATIEDDRARSRPRVWEVAHAVEQAAQYIARDGTWNRRLPTDGKLPTVHFGPIAAGDRAFYSQISPDAQWIREHYNDALAIEMEGAGAAQASHLNDSLPMALVRGISDRGDGTKTATDGVGWQPRAVAGAAAFALALAAQLGTQPTARPRAVRKSVPPPGSPMRPDTPLKVTNHATSSRVGVQAGQIFGDVRVGPENAVPSAGVLSLLAGLRLDLDRAYDAGRIDEEVRQAALEEIDNAKTAARDRQSNRVMIAVKRLSGLISDLAEFGAQLAAIMSAVRGMS
jgi:adenosylhomocysteine nucleosidase